MRILVIEDETKVGCFIKRALEEESYAVDLCEDGAKGLQMALNTNYDLLIVDLMLPSLPGLEILKGVRQARIQTPILILTAQSQVDQRVKGLDAGADDYLTKPFAFSELMARLGALTRRPPLAQIETVLQVADLEMDLIGHRVKRGGKEIDLQPREFRLLEYLMRNVGRVVTRTMLLEKVWEFHFDPKTKIVETHISRLRAKIGRGAPDLIQTIRGSGYVIRPPS